MVRSTAIDLFAGAGGATQGLIDADFDVLAAVEKDGVAAESYAANHPDVRLYREDIKDVDPRIVLKETGITSGDLDLLQACPPCQTWSSLSVHDSADPRNDLIFDVVRFARTMRPKALVLENVPGLSGDIRFGRFLARIRRLGYGVRRYEVDAQQFGVPQRRKRLILLAIRGLDGRRLPRDLVTSLPAGFDATSKRLLDVLRTAGPLDRGDALHSRRVLPALVAERIRHIPRGGSRFDLPDSLRLACHTRLSRRNATGAYGRMTVVGPAPTLTTRCTTPACGPYIHPTANRPITLREAALIQTFPANYRFSGSRAQVERQIGNAIPVRMAHGVAAVAGRLLQARPEALDG